LREQPVDSTKPGGNLIDTYSQNYIFSESSKTSEAKPFYRILDQDENVWKSQQRWRSRAGRFMLEKREIALFYEKVGF
jgi:hypothetical protein